MSENLKDKQWVYESTSCPFCPEKTITRKTNIYTCVQIRHVMIIAERTFNDQLNSISYTLVILRRQGRREQLLP